MPALVVRARRGSCERTPVGWLRRLFGSGAGGERDPDAVVWVATVALWQAPLVVHELGEQRIKATFVENSSRSLIFGGAPAARIYVHQLHREEAERIILDVTGPGERDAPT